MTLGLPESAKMTPDEACVGVESPADGRAHDDGDDLAPVKRFNRILGRSGVRRKARGCDDKSTWQTIRHAGSFAASLFHQDGGRYTSDWRARSNDGRRQPEQSAD